MASLYIILVGSIHVGPYAEDWYQEEYLTSVLVVVLFGHVRAVESSVKKV